MKVNDAVIGVLVIIFAVIMMSYASTFPNPTANKPGPALFPMVIGGLFILTGLVLVFRGVRSRAPLLILEDWARDRVGQGYALAILAAILIYIYLVDWLGFIPLSILLMVVLMKLYRVRTLPAIAAAVLTTFAAHTLFVKFLLVPLPWGLLDPIAW